MPQNTNEPTATNDPLSSDDSLEDFDPNSDGGNDDSDFDYNNGDANPFNDKPKFDAGVEADEETDPKKFIEQLSGKLGQSLRAYTDENGQVDSQLEKYAINSVISATHPDQMDQNDLNDIINKLNSSEDDGDNSDNDDSNNQDNEPNDDNIDENFVLDKEHKQVFQDAKLGLNESKNRNIEKYLVSLVNPKLLKKEIEMESKVKNETPVETPTRPIVKPVETPNRRSMPYKPRITPRVNPEPKQKL